MAARWGDLCLESLLRGYQSPLGTWELRWRGPRRPRRKHRQKPGRDSGRPCIHHTGLSSPAREPLALRELHHQQPTWQGEAPGDRGGGRSRSPGPQDRSSRVAAPDEAWSLPCTPPGPLLGFEARLAWVAAGSAVSRRWPLVSGLPAHTATGAGGGDGPRGRGSAGGWVPGGAAQPPSLQIPVFCVSFCHRVWGPRLHSVGLVCTLAPLPPRPPPFRVCVGVPVLGSVLSCVLSLSPSAEPLILGVVYLFLSGLCARRRAGLRS